MASAGALWIVKSVAILATGLQPPWIYELGQILVAGGALGLLGLLRDRTATAARTALVSATLAIAGGAGVALGALGGWSTSSAQSFVVPWSLFHLLLALGGFVSLVALGLAARRERGVGAVSAVPVPIVLAPLPLLLAGFVHVELPVLAIGSSWLLLAGWVRAASRAHPQPSVVRTSR